MHYNALKKYCTKVTYYKRKMKILYIGYKDISTHAPLQDVMEHAVNKIKKNIPLQCNFVGSYFRLDISHHLAFFFTKPCGRLLLPDDGFSSRNLSPTKICTVSLYMTVLYNTWSDNKVRELIAVKVLHTSLLNTTVVAFKVLRLGSYAPMPAPCPPFKTILQLVLWDDLQSCRCITPDDINVIKMPSFQYFLYPREQKKVIGS